MYLETWLFRKLHNEQVWLQNAGNALWSISHLPVRRQVAFSTLATIPFRYKKVKVSAGDRQSSSFNPDATDPSPQWLDRG